jgi:hypothetical protein
MHSPPSLYLSQLITGGHTNIYSVTVVGAIRDVGGKLVIVVAHLRRQMRAKRVLQAEAHEVIHIGDIIDCASLVYGILNLGS